MTALEFRVSGTLEVEEMFERMGERARNPHRLWDKLRDRFIDFEWEQFDSEGGAHHWAPLASSYSAWKSKHFGNLPILVRSAHLEATLTHGLAVDERTGDSATFGTDDRVAKFHQQGTRKMPERTIVDLSEREVHAWQDEMAEFVMGRGDYI